MEIPRFRFDFSFLDIESLSAHCISPDKIESTFYDVQSVYDNFEEEEDVEYMIGFSLKNKFLAFTFTLTDGETIRFIQVYLPHEPEIRYRYYSR